MLGVLLRILGVIAVTAAAGLVAYHSGGGTAKDGAPLLAFLGAVSFFFAENLASVVWVSHGLQTRASPVVAFRILGVVMWGVAVVCILA